MEDSHDTPTVGDGPPPPIDASIEGDGSHGIESRVVLARARAKLLGAEQPTSVGRYRVVGRLGQGGMGIVYEGRDDALDRAVAVKILRTDRLKGSNGRQRLLREAQALAKLSHPNVVHVYEVGEDAGQVYLAMELVRGDTLRRWADREPRTAAQIIDIFVKVGEGLAAAHARGIVHRDFKPDNAIVGDDDGRPRVVDFGLARARGDTTGEITVVPPESFPSPLHDSAITETGAVLGTPAYMAPEQLERREPDERSDQFSFAVALFELLFGRRPFRGSTYSELARRISNDPPERVDPTTHGVSRGVQLVLLRAMARDPNARYPSMRALLDDLRRAAAPHRRRMPAIAVLAAAALATVWWARSDRSTTVDTDRITTSIEVEDPWASIVEASDLPPLVATPSADDPSGVSVHRLRNGLTIYVAERPFEPAITTVLALRAGTREEGPYGARLALLTLDLVSEGSDRLGVVDALAEAPALATEHALLSALPELATANERDQLLRAVATVEMLAAELVRPYEFWDTSAALDSSDLAGYTGQGATWGLKVPLHRLPAWLELTAEVLQRPAFRSGYSVVQRELAGLVPSDSLGAEEAVVDLLDAATGYRSYAHDDARAFLSSFPIAAAQRFHSEFYRPNNVAIVLIGDITPADAIELVERHFGAWEPQPIPEVPVVDRPLAERVVRRKVEDAGRTEVIVGWPLPPETDPEFDGLTSLASSIDHQDGLGAVLREVVADIGTYRDGARNLIIRAAPRPGQSLDDVEREVLQLVQRIADDDLSDATWERALARAELEGHQWARDPSDLAYIVANSFTGHRQWSAIATRLSRAPTKDELVHAAAILLARDRVVVHRRTGKPHKSAPPSVATTVVPKRYFGFSRFARSLIDARVTPPEPQFLVQGTRFSSTTYGAGRWIATEDQGPLVRIGWIYPVGVDRDPFVCAAVRARARASPVAGVDLYVSCANNYVWIELDAVASRFGERMADVFAWLDHGMPSDEELEMSVHLELEARAAMRSSAAHREAAFHAWTLRGDSSIDAHLPADDALRRGGVARLRASLSRLAKYDPTVLYVGPDADDVRRALPPPRGRVPVQRVAPVVAQLERTRVVLLHDPDRDDISVRVALPWTERSAKDTVPALVHADATWYLLYAGPPQLQAIAPYSMWWLPAHPLAIEAMYRAAPRDALLATQTALQLVRHRLDPAEFAHARERMELRFRAARVQIADVPRRVFSWSGAAADPRMAEWVALAGLQIEDYERYERSIADAPLLVAIVGDADRIDLAALEAIAPIERIDATEFEPRMRDPTFSDWPF